MQKRAIMAKIRVQKFILGQALKSARKDSKLSQQELAAEAGLHRNAIVAIEAGRGHMASLAAAAAALGLRISARTAPEAESLGACLKAQRKRQRLSRRTVASMAGISVPTIEGLEATSTGHVATLEALARAMGAGLRLVPVAAPKSFAVTTATSSASEEWYTPAWVLESVTRVLGSIDTDPASPGRGKSLVEAKLHFTLAEDGLSHAWPGLVWLNPPYGSRIDRWLEKARHELMVGHAHKVVALVPARTDTRWWHSHVAQHADILMIRGRLQFVGATASAPFPSALLGYGLNENERDRLFSAFPDAWHVRKARFQTPEALADAAD